MVVLKSPSKRAHLLVLKNLGFSNRAVAKELGGVHPDTVSKLWRGHLKGHNIFKIRHSTGRPRKFSHSDARWAALLIARELAKTAADIQRDYFPHISADTIRRRLRELDLRVYKRRKRPFLPYRAKQRRFWWARIFAEWSSTDWAHVGFSDESKFLVFGTGGPKIVWRRPGAPPKPSDSRPVVKHGGGSVMVWGFITRLGVGRIFRIEGRMNAAKYVEILSEAYLGTLPEFGLRLCDLIFQHDNDPKHKSLHATRWLLNHRIRVLPWPSHSPDMNPIEHVWAYLDAQVRAQAVLPRNQDELWNALEKEWYKIPSTFIAGLYNSMPKRVATLLEVKGGHTSY